MRLLKDIGAGRELFCGRDDEVRLLKPGRYFLIEPVPDQSWVMAILRVSSDLQLENRSLEGQLADARAKAVANGQVLTGFYLDPGESASAQSLDHRPGMGACIQDIERNILSTVYFYMRDRLARRVEDQLRFHTICSRHKVAALPTSNEPPFSDTPEGRIYEIFAGFQNEMEARKIGQRSIEGYRRKHERGEFPGTIPPFGYVRNQLTRALEPHPEEAPIVQSIFDAYVKGVGPREIVEQILKGKIRRSRRWTRKSVLKTLKNPAYCGRSVLASASHGKGRNSAKAKTIRDGDPEMLPALVRPDVWDLARAIMTDNERKNRPKREIVGTRVRSSHLLGSLVRCSRCKSYLVIHDRWRKKKAEACSVREYVCPNGREKNCNWRGSVVADLLEETVVGGVLAWLDAEGETAIANYTECLNQLFLRLEQDLVQVGRQAAAEKNRAATYRKLLDEAINTNASDLVREHNQTLAECLKGSREAEKGVAELEAQIEKLKDQDIRRSETLRVLDSWAKEFSGADLSGRQHLLARLVREIRFYPQDGGGRRLAVLHIREEICGGIGTQNGTDTVPDSPLCVPIELPIGRRRKGLIK